MLMAHNCMRLYLFLFYLFSVVTHNANCGEYLLRISDVPFHPENDTGFVPRPAFIFFINKWCGVPCAFAFSCRLSKLILFSVLHLRHFTFIVISKICNEQLYFLSVSTLMRGNLNCGMRICLCKSMTQAQLCERSMNANMFRFSDDLHGVFLVFFVSLRLYHQFLVEQSASHCSMLYMIPHTPHAHFHWNTCASHWTLTPHSNYFIMAYALLLYSLCQILRTAAIFAGFIELTDIWWSCLEYRSCRICVLNVMGYHTNSSGLQCMQMRFVRRCGGSSIAVCASTACLRRSNIPWMCHCEISARVTLPCTIWTSDDPLSGYVQLFRTTIDKV